MLEFGLGGVLGGEAGSSPGSALSLGVWGEFDAVAPDAMIAAAALRACRAELAGGFNRSMQHLDL